MKDTRYKLYYYNNLNKKAKPFYETPPLELDVVLCRLLFELEAVRCLPIIKNGYFKSTKHKDGIYTRRFIVETNVPPIKIVINRLGVNIDIDEFNERLMFLFKKFYNEEFL